MSESQYATHFVPLESDPEIFSDLLHSLGASRKVVFEEVYSLDGSVEVPHPALSLILILPTSKAYEENKAREEAIIASTEHNGGEVVWFKQTINNACGLYAILHAICNSIDSWDEHEKSLILPGSFLAKLLDTKPEEKTRFLECSEELKQLYAAAAARGNTAPPAPDDEVDFHFVCFVKAGPTSIIYELDGDRNGPIPRGTAISAQDDMLTGVGLQILRDTIKRENGESVGFSLMALTKVGQ
ncbi:cysteine proteinase [Plenodomus tracheiphilus IPT5]|uniref:Ubiquitin carboxyl-terminal hydrolase n=1 Tax=Plenodomus tracheiphilus IPT5 TaxID=1408161 RepID=A0A6A7AQR6_9PLEO|nr:cysteine proteinase [Plenodomus tracheiphilus IPT5]